MKIIIDYQITDPIGQVELEIESLEEWDQMPVERKHLMMIEAAEADASYPTIEITDYKFEE